MKKTQKGTKHPREDYERDYLNFVDGESIPLHTGLYIEDIREVGVDDWDRTGAKGAIINLKGMEGLCDIHVHEIPPQTSLKSQRHLYDALVYVVNGSGFTTIGEEEDQTTFEWTDDAVFYLPENTPYSTRNITETEARLIMLTPLPLLYAIHRSDEIIWENDQYTEWPPEDPETFYSSQLRTTKGTDRSGHTRTYWESNFLPNAVSFDQLEDRNKRGGGSRSIYLPFRQSSMYSHISEFPSGKYKKGHRHLSGANVIMISGEGYTYVWREHENERIRLDWDPYTLFTPPTKWYHQFFNTSEVPARYLVLHGPIQGTGVRAKNEEFWDSHANNQIEYEEEDPDIRREFKSTIQEKGIEFKMDDVS